MALWLGFNLAETTSVQKMPTAGTQLSEAPVVEAGHEEIPEQGKWQEAHRAGNWDSEKWNHQKAHAAQPQIPDLQLR